MKVALLGYNIDILSLLDYKNHSIQNFQTFSPEIITASYAKISRSEKDILTLREEVKLDINKARQFNKKIIFDMGHSSVAEHAVFNFDISEISRLALEYLEHFRLASYTEKSQRYVTFRDNFYIPNEIKNQEFLEGFKRIIASQFNFYKELREEIKNFLLDNKNSSEIGFACLTLTNALYNDLIKDDLPLPDGPNNITLH